MIIDLHVPDLTLIDYRTLKPFQGDLKDLYETNFNKLERQLKKKGFFSPFHVWKHEGQFKILDGHQRQRVLIKNDVKLRHNGEETYLVPCLVVEAENEKDAAEKLLAISSQYGTITQEGYHDFSIEYELEEIDLEDFNFDRIFTDLPDIELDEVEAANTDDVEAKGIITLSFDDPENAKKAKPLLDAALEAFNVSVSVR